MTNSLMLSWPPSCARSTSKKQKTESRSQNKNKRWFRPYPPLNSGPCLLFRDQDLLTTARMFAADAVALKQEFTKRGLSVNFLEALNEDSTAFEQALA